MSLSALLIIAISLSFDAFGASVSRGAAVRGHAVPGAFRTALVFGFFALCAPLVGWAVGKALYNEIRAYDHWIAFVLLAGVGTKMLHDGLRGADVGPAPVGYRAVLLALSAIATSIDAAVIGLGLPFLQVSIVLASAIIGGVTTAAAYVGVHVGAAGGRAFGPKAEIAGGLVLIAIGIRILVDHLSH